MVGGRGRHSASLLMGVETIAVIGMGSVGRGIAYKAVLGRYRTVLEDVSSERLMESVAWLKRVLAEAASRGEIDAGTRAAAELLISTAPSVEDAIRDADLILEAVPDEMEMKLELFTLFDKFARPGAILASSSAVFSIGELTDVTTSQERCIGMRFCDSGRDEKTVELVKMRVTSSETIAACVEVARRMGRAAVIIEEAPEKIETQNPRSTERPATESKL